MATQPPAAEIETTGADLLTTGANSDLHNRLTIKPPQDARTMPPVLSIERRREVEIPWQDILGADAVGGNTSISAIQNYFEDAWNIDNTDKQLIDLTEGSTSQIKAIATEDSNGEQTVLDVYRANPAEPSEPEKVPSGVVLQHGISGRWYLAISNSGDPLTIDDFKTSRIYADTWKHKIDGVELVFRNEDEAKQNYTDYSEVDLRPLTIKRVFNELLLEETFADDVYTNVSAATKKSIEQIVSSGMDTEKLERLHEKSFRLKRQQAEVVRRLGRLKSQALDLGYYLFLDNDEFSFPDGEKRKVEKGQIYRQFKREARWTTTATRWVKKSAKVMWIFPTSKAVKEKYSVPHSKVVADYSLVDTNRDPVVDKVTELRKLGMQVFIFEHSPDGFVSTDGTLLRTVMEQCDRNESFRRQCAILLPVFEESLTGQRALVKYSVFLRPLPGIAPTILPRMVLRESLSYRTAWKESQLGELVSTINLAPGEERTVVVTKTFEQETSITKSSTSIFDVSRTESSDLASEMENQARSESERSSNMQFSSKVSGGWGAVSAEASASGGTSTSLKNFSQAISKVAKKAAQSINQQSREEVSSSSTASVKVANSDEMTANIRNINQGRTLNLLFYRLNNKFEGGIYIDELQFEVIPSTEIIADSGVHEALSFGLGELAGVIDEFKLARLPFDLNTESVVYLERVLSSIESLLLDEYGLKEEEIPPQKSNDGEFQLSVNTPLAPTMSVGVLSVPVSITPTPPKKKRGVAAANAWQERLNHLSDALKLGTLDRVKPMQQDDLILPSGGLYLDTVVGTLPSTEPYSEEMRTQEVELRKAEVALKESEAAYQRAMAKRVSSSGTPPGNLANWLTGVLPDGDKEYLTLSLKMPLSAGNWELLVDDKKRATLDPSCCGKKLITQTWDKKQTWLDGECLFDRVTLKESASGDLISGK